MKGRNGNGQKNAILAGGCTRADVSLPELRRRESVLEFLSDAK